MKKKMKTFRICVVIILCGILSACGHSAESPTDESPTDPGSVTNAAESENAQKDGKTMVMKIGGT